jgi:hypothetical protein
MNNPEGAGMRGGVFAWLVGLFAGLAMCGCFAEEKVYKVIGSDGKISFTDKDPAAGHSDHPQAGVAEQIEVKENYSNKVPVTLVGSTSYCGSIALPLRDLFTTNFYSTVANSDRNWLSDRNRLIQTMSQVNRNFRYTTSTGPGPFTSENYKHLSELNCAVDWAHQQKDLALIQKDEQQKKSEGLSNYLNELSSGVREICGGEPIYSMDDRLYADKRATWQRCTNDHESKIREVQTDLRRTDDLLHDIKLIEEMP